MLVSRPGFAECSRTGRRRAATDAPARQRWPASASAPTLATAHANSAFRPCGASDAAARRCQRRSCCRCPAPWPSTGQTVALPCWARSRGGTVPAGVVSPRAAWPQMVRSAIRRLILAIALAGFRPFGQVLVPLRMAWQRYSLKGSLSSSRRSPVASSRESEIQR